MKEGLPSLSGYLVLQMSEDMSSLYVAYAQINKERKFQYYIDRTTLSVVQR